MAAAGSLAAALGACSTVPPVPLPTASSARPSASATTATPGPSPSTPQVVLPDADRVRARLAKVSRSGIGTSGIVVLAPDGSVVAGRNAGEPLAPASTLKLLTGLAALDTLGAEHTFTTRVVSSGAGRIILVGGGDPLLTDRASTAASRPASLQALARSTAAALKAEGVRRVSLAWDDTLFSGPDYSPDWKRGWRNWLARVNPLVSDEGRFNPWQSDPEPARTTARAFAKRLERLGVRVTAVRARPAPAGAAELARVESAPLRTVLARTLRLSDNLAAEVLARHVALASGETPSFAGATRALKDWLVGHALWDDGMRLVDGSGLATRSRVTPAVLAGAVARSLSSEQLGALAAGLPVAGRNGTLKHRFDDAAERVGRGNVHAKTGTLRGIGGLAGYLTTRDGVTLVFAALANDTRGQTTSYNWLDRSAAALVRCGCN